MKISIVMPTFNQGSFLPLALASVLEQKGDFDLQLLVIDGGSTDQTLDILKACDDPRLQWISEPDRGQAHAINKGMGMADGDVLAWLNSDDLYLPGALDAVARTFSSQPGTRWLVGGCRIINERGDEIRPAITRYKQRRLARYAYRRLLRENIISQPAVFWRGDFGALAGPLDESLHYTMDYDLWLRMARLSAPRIDPTPLAAFRLHGQSKSGGVNRAQFDEQYRVAKRYFDGDAASQVVHRFNVEKVVWAYRFLRLMGR